MFKKPSFEQEILSVLYIPDIQGRPWIVVKVAEKNLTLGRLRGPYCSLYCSTCLLCCSIKFWCQLGTTGTLSWRFLLQRWSVLWFQVKSRIDVCMPDTHPDAFCLILRQVHFSFVCSCLTHPNMCPLPQLLTLTKSVTYVLLLSNTVLKITCLFSPPHPLPHCAKTAWLLGFDRDTIWEAVC